MVLKPLAEFGKIRAVAWISIFDKTRNEIFVGFVMFIDPLLEGFAVSQATECLKEEILAVPP